MHYAHSTGDLDRGTWQTLPDHLQAVADLAGAKATAFGMSSAAGLAGWFHDIGKCAESFDRRLCGGPSVEHSLAGAYLVRKRNETGIDRLMADLVAYAIAGHHAGLPDWSGDGSSLTARLELFEQNDLKKLDPAWMGYIPPRLESLAPKRKLDPDGAWGFSLAMLGRMLFSCLADADFQDTEQFYARVEGAHHRPHMTASCRSATRLHFQLRCLHGEEDVLRGRQPGQSASGRRSRPCPYPYR